MSTFELLTKAIVLRDEATARNSALHSAVRDAGIFALTDHTTTADESIAAVLDLCGIDGVALYVRWSESSSASLYYGQLVEVLEARMVVEARAQIEAATRVTERADDAAAVW